MTPLQLPTDGSYVSIGTGLTTAVVQASGDVQVSYSGTGAGFDLPSGIPVAIPEIAAFGGDLFARSITGGWIKSETA